MPKKEKDSETSY